MPDTPDTAAVAAACERWRHYCGGDLEAYLSHVTDAMILADAYCQGPPASVVEAAKGWFDCFNDSSGIKMAEWILEQRRG